jgi:mxaC protein
MNLGFDTPMVLVLLPLALLPVIFAVQRPQGYPSLDAVESDALSRAVDVGLHFSGLIAIAALVAALAGIHLKGQTIERVGEGANVVLLLDRSSSMDDTFAGRPPGEGEASKSAAARRLLREFIARRPHDRFGVAHANVRAAHDRPQGCRFGRHRCDHTSGSGLHQRGVRPIARAVHARGRSVGGFARNPACL